MRQYTALVYRVTPPFESTATLMLAAFRTALDTTTVIPVPRVTVGMQVVLLILLLVVVIVATLFLMRLWGTLCWEAAARQFDRAPHLARESPRPTRMGVAIVPARVLALALEGEGVVVVVVTDTPPERLPMLELRHAHTHQWPGSPCGGMRSRQMMRIHR